MDGFDVVGALDGPREGTRDGDLVGVRDGLLVGLRVGSVGRPVGCKVGLAVAGVGRFVGDLEGVDVVGLFEGCVGNAVGVAEGVELGTMVAQAAASVVWTMAVTLKSVVVKTSRLALETTGAETSAQ